MIRVKTGSRLHFGLMNVGNPSTLGAFGGIGMMIDRPGLELEVTPAPKWSAFGPLAERALAIARRFVNTQTAHTAHPLEFRIRTCAPEHVGLGSGTQLSLAVARALAGAFGSNNVDIENLARVVHRGARSSIGIHGFMRGGFLADAGMSVCADVARIVDRVDFPHAWRVVVVIPPRQQGVHGVAESRAFEDLKSRAWPGGLADRLAQLIHQSILPALLEQNLARFSDALFEYNSKVGEAFASVQGGRYASPSVAELVAFIRGEGVHGVGQSSWGPAVFAVTADPQQAEILASKVTQLFALPADAVTICKGLNRGATIESIDAD